MEQFLGGLALIFIGLLFTFAGYQLFRILIPIWGFLAGFSWIADVFSLGNEAGFLTSLFGIIVALVTGVVLAAAAYFFYQFAVALFATSIGYWLVGGLLLGLGFPFGFLGVIVALSAGIALAWAAIYYNAPKGLLVVLSGIGGGMLVISGLLLMFGVIPSFILGYGMMGYIIRQSFFWTISWIGLSVIGMISQAQISKTMDTSYYSYPSSYTPYTGAKGGTTSKKAEDEEAPSDSE